MRFEGVPSNIIKKQCCRFKKGFRGKGFAFLSLNTVCIFTSDSYELLYVVALQDLLKIMIYFGIIFVGIYGTQVGVNWEIKIKLMWHKIKYNQIKHTITTYASK